jgi:hypothetical protein
MNKLISFSLVGVLGLLLLGGAQLLAPSSTPSQTGKVLVLDTERTLEGDIDLVGQQYRIRRTIGETFVPANRVLALCASMEDALRFLRGRCNLHDPDERLRLSEWCRVRGLRELAIEEVRAAVALRPEHAPSQRMLQILTAQATIRPAGPGPANDPEPGPLPSLDLNAEAMTQFTTRIQPILMNACANCHATGKGGSFKLLRTYEEALVPQRTTVNNAAAVLAQINLEQPLQSQLLNKALNQHGDMTVPPFKNRQAPAFRTLEDWVRVAASTHPQREPVPMTPLPMSAVPAPTAPGFAADRGTEPLPTTGGDLPRPPASGGDPPRPPVPADRTAPRPLPTSPATQTGPTPVDPFDPEPFNRQNTPAPTPMPRPPMPPRS